MAKGNARAGFDIDLLDGMMSEEALARILLKAKVEVKRQEKALESGNAAVEIRQGKPKLGEGRPSGLSITEADWWAFDIPEVCWIILPTGRLKALIKKGKWRRLMCGDDNLYENFLIPVAELVRQAPWEKGRLNENKEAA